MEATNLGRVERKKEAVAVRRHRRLAATTHVPVHAVVLICIMAVQCIAGVAPLQTFSLGKDRSEGSMPQITSGKGSIPNNSIMRNIDDHINQATTGKEDESSASAPARALQNATLNTQTLTTTMMGGSFQAGNMFDLISKQDIKIRSFDLHLTGTIEYDAQIYTKLGSFVDHTADSSSWGVLVDLIDIIGFGLGKRTPLGLDEFDPVLMMNGSRRAFYITTVTQQELWLAYSVGTKEGAVFVEDNYLQFLEGIGIMYPFGTVFSPRIFNGAILYTIDIFPSGMPTSTPSFEPSAYPTRLPSFSPSTMPSKLPSVRPSSGPTFNPTTEPSITPFASPSGIPSLKPSYKPSQSQSPTLSPTVLPSVLPSMLPSSLPSLIPSSKPSGPPTFFPSSKPSGPPTFFPSSKPSLSPSHSPTYDPSNIPSSLPSIGKTTSPSDVQTIPKITTGRTPAPSFHPSMQPSLMPSQEPSSVPSMEPSYIPTLLPTSAPSLQPSNIPSKFPTQIPTVAPSLLPSDIPSKFPSHMPTVAPSLLPSNIPSKFPTQAPSLFPSDIPSFQPTVLVSEMPSAHPTDIPSSEPIVTQYPTGAIQYSTLYTLVLDSPNRLMNSTEIDSFQISVNNFLQYYLTLIDSPLEVLGVTILNQTLKQDYSIFVSSPSSSDVRLLRKMQNGISSFVYSLDVLIEVACRAPSGFDLDGALQNIFDENVEGLIAFIDSGYFEEIDSIVLETSYTEFMTFLIVDTPNRVLNSTEVEILEEFILEVIQEYSANSTVDLLEVTIVSQTLVQTGPNEYTLEVTVEVTCSSPPNFDLYGALTKAFNQGLAKMSTLAEGIEYFEGVEDIELAHTPSQSPTAYGHSELMTFFLEDSPNREMNATEVEILEQSLFEFLQDHTANSTVEVLAVNIVSQTVVQVGPDEYMLEAVVEVICVASSNVDWHDVLLETFEDHIGDLKSYIEGGDYFEDIANIVANQGAAYVPSIHPSLPPTNSKQFEYKNFYIVDSPSHEMNETEVEHFESSIYNFLTDYTANLSIEIVDVTVITQTIGEDDGTYTNNVYIQIECSEGGTGTEGQSLNDSLNQLFEDYVSELNSYVEGAGYFEDVDSFQTIYTPSPSAQSTTEDAIDAGVLAAAAAAAAAASASAAAAASASSGGSDPAGDGGNDTNSSEGKETRAEKNKAAEEEARKQMSNRNRKKVAGKQIQDTKKRSKAMQAKLKKQQQQRLNLKSLRCKSCGGIVEISECDKSKNDQGHDEYICHNCGILSDHDVDYELGQIREQDIVEPVNRRVKLSATGSVARVISHAFEQMNDIEKPNTSKSSSRGYSISG